MVAITNPVLKYTKLALQFKNPRFSIDQIFYLHLKTRLELIYYTCIFETTKSFSIYFHIAFYEFDENLRYLFSDDKMYAGLFILQGILIFCTSDSVNTCM